MKEIDKIIESIDEKDENRIDWTKAWSKKYSVLTSYQKKVDTKKYSVQIRKLLEDLKAEYGYDELDAMLVLKDILYHEWKDQKR